MLSCVTQFAQTLYVVIEVRGQDDFEVFGAGSEDQVFASGSIVSLIISANAHPL